jgi:CBS domain-containing protein
MAKRVATVNANDCLEIALKKMVERHTGNVVVIEGSRAVGIFTERDVARILSKSNWDPKARVAGLMSKPLVIVRPSTHNLEAIKKLLEHGIRRLPVVEKQELVGIVTERDLLRWILQITHEPKISPEIRRILAKRRSGASDHAKIT